MDFKPEQAQQVLALELPAQSDFGNVTIRQALIRLLAMVWDETEGFNGYRPLGNSDWTDQITDSVIDAGLAVDWDEANKLVQYSISSLSK